MLCGLTFEEHVLKSDIDGRLLVQATLQEEDAAAESAIERQRKNHELNSLVKFPHEEIHKDPEM